MPEKKLKTTATKKAPSKKEIKKVEVKKTEVKKTLEKKLVKDTKTEKVNSELKVDVLNTLGEKETTITLPERIFGVKVNPHLIAQAVRVYLVNQRQGTVATKTRGEVDGSTRKIYRQKGTGRARHGGIRAPIFVKGGIAHGPKPKDYFLSLPKKMKRAALFSALSGKLKDGGVKIITGVEALDAKTKVYAKAFDKWGLIKKDRKVLFVLPKNMENVYKSTRNLYGVTVTTANMLNTYEVLQHKTIVMMKEAIQTIEETFAKSEEK